MPGRGIRIVIPGPNPCPRAAKLLASVPSFISLEHSDDQEVPGVTLLSKRFEDAMIYAAQLHAAQQRKGTEIPYVAHLMSVAALVLEAGGDEDQAIAALLHDAVEDQGGPETRERIRERF